MQNNDEYNTIKQYPAKITGSPLRSGNTPLRSGNTPLRSAFLPLCGVMGLKLQERVPSLVRAKARADAELRKRAGLEKRPKSTYQPQKGRSLHGVQNARLAARKKAQFTYEDTATQTMISTEPPTEPPKRVQQRVVSTAKKRRRRSPQSMGKGDDSTHTFNNPLSPSIQGKTV